MGLGGGREVFLDSDVELLAGVAAPEPHAAAGAQLLRLLDLLEAEQLAIEAPGLLLTPRWRRHLHVIDAGDRHQAARRAWSVPSRSASSSSRKPPMARSPTRICGNVIWPVRRTRSARPSGSLARLISSYARPRAASSAFAWRQKPHGSVVNSVILWAPPSAIGRKV